jgi:signal transduction histidine kinase
MADPALVERVAQVHALRSAPRHEIEWLVDHGILARVGPETSLRPDNMEVRTLDGVTLDIHGLMVILQGKMSIHVERGGIHRRVMEWHAGDLTGAMPYSRMKAPPGNTVFHEYTEALYVPSTHFRELTMACPEVTAICVHTMLDRARHFTSTDLQDEKLMSLGRLSAGLAHELNNPASAATRSAERLSHEMGEAEDAARALVTSHLSEQQRALLDEVRALCLVVPPSFLDTPLDRADRVDAISEWLDEHGGDLDHAAALAETAVTIEALNKLAASLDHETLVEAVRWLAACHAVRSAAADIQTATRRISDLVAAVKGFTYMGRAAVAEPVDLARGLADTVRILSGKARDKAVTVAMEIQPDLPPARAFGSELNQIWGNILDNAIDAVAYGGMVTVSAERDLRWIVVRIVDNGAGIPDEIRDRIFDPFFTTKPVGEGTGMGLDMVRRLVFHQSGEIDVESRPGRTEFRVAIPIAAPTPATASAAAG